MLSSTHPKSPIPDVNAAARTQKIHELALLNGASIASLDRITRFVHKIIGADASLITVLDSEYLHIVSFDGMKHMFASKPIFPIHESLCYRVVTNREPLIIADVNTYPDELGNYTYTKMGYLAYAGIPLIMPDGEPIGVLCVIKQAPHAWTADEIENLTQFALSTISEIQLHGIQYQHNLINHDVIAYASFIDKVVTTIPDLIFIYDLTTRQQIYSSHHKTSPLEATCHHDQPQGLPLDLWIHHEQDSHVVKTIRDAVSVAEDGDIVENEYLITTDTGEHRWIHTRLSPFKRDPITGEVTQAIGVSQDVTQRHEMQEQTQRILQQLSWVRQVETELSSTLDLDEVASLAMKAIIDFSKAQHGYIALVVDENVSTLQPLNTLGGYVGRDEYPAHTGIVARVMAKREGELILDVGQVPDDEPMVSATKAQICIPLINHEHLIGVILIETETENHFTHELFEFVRLIGSRLTTSIENARLYKLAQTQLREITEMYERIAELENIKTDMLRIAAHDLRNPLTAIMGFVSLLERDETVIPPSLQDFYTVVKLCTQKMYTITENILSLQRIEALTAKTHNEPINITDMLQTLSFEQAYFAQQKQIKLTADLPTESLFVEGDGVELREAFENLVTNAVKYTPPQGRIHVELKPQDENRIQVLICDNGYGIPHDQQGRIFQPFFRAKSKETETIDGMGLGLHLVKRILERHQGEIQFESHEGQGTTFFVSLPLL